MHGIRLGAGAVFFMGAYERKPDVLGGFTYSIGWKMTKRAKVGCRARLMFMVLT